MSILRRDIYRKKLTSLLQAADDEEFFVMVWAAHAIQTGRAVHARRFLEFPREAVTTDLSSDFAVHPWRCETLLNEVLATPKSAIIPGRPNRRLNCKTFKAVARASNLLSALEDAEDGVILKRVDVLKELHRLSQRQFEWQRGFMTMANFYRSAFIYGGEKTKAYFAQSTGISMDEFSLACFAVGVASRSSPFFRPNIDLSNIGISPGTLRGVLRLISIPHAAARRRAAEIRSRGRQTAYKRSLFRDYPCVSFGASGERVHAPLPDLVAVRATTGIFYDVIGGGGDVRNEFGGRFEDYCRDLLAHMLPNSSVRASFKYQVKKGALIGTPDILLGDRAGAVSVVFECKAARMSYEARYAEDPVATAQTGFKDIAKGVFQIWRFASHLRRGLVPGASLQPGLRGVVLTLDTWLSAPSTLNEEVMALATARADKDPGITETDRIPVLFCSIDDLEFTLNAASQASFFQALDAIDEDRFRGWRLSNLHEKVAPGVNMDNGYPFKDRIVEVLPWWDQFRS